MKHVKIWTAVCLLGLTVACSQSMKDKLFGTDTVSSGNSAGSVPTAAGSVDDQLMAKVAADIPAVITGVKPGGFAAASASGCTPGSITTSSTTVTYPPSVYRSSNVYTVNGTTYFAGTYADSSGGTLSIVKQMNGTCLEKNLVYGILSVQGSSYMQWGSNPVQYRYYYYTYTYSYRGNVVLMDGHYTIGTEKGSTEYPIHYSFPI